MVPNRQRRQSGIVEAQLDVGRQTVPAGQLADPCQQKRSGLFATHALCLGFRKRLLNSCVNRIPRHSKFRRDGIRNYHATVQTHTPLGVQYLSNCGGSVQAVIHLECAIAREKGRQ